MARSRISNISVSNNPEDGPGANNNLSSSSGPPDPPRVRLKSIQMILKRMIPQEAMWSIFDDGWRRRRRRQDNGLQFRNILYAVYEPIYYHIIVSIKSHRFVGRMWVCVSASEISLGGGCLQGGFDSFVLIC